jgi:Zn-dependent peptidase ImmA (M78 family)
MGYTRGFKKAATEIAAETRAELRLGPLDRLDPRVLAEHLDIDVHDLSDIAEQVPDARHVMVAEPEAFSAVTVFRGLERAITHNDAHSLPRQNSNICHELSHGLLMHPSTPALGDSGCRIFNKDVEDEAGYLSGCLLVTEEVTFKIARGHWSPSEAASRLMVSEAMIRFRLNATGAALRVKRAAAAFARR